MLGGQPAVRHINNMHTTTSSKHLCRCTVDLICYISANPIATLRARCVIPANTVLVEVNATHQPHGNILALGCGGVDAGQNVGIKPFVKDGVRGEIAFALRDIQSDERLVAGQR